MRWCRLGRFNDSNQLEQGLCYYGLMSREHKDPAHRQDLDEELDFDEDFDPGLGPDDGRPAPGKRTLTQLLGPRRLQFRGGKGGDPERARRLAQRGASSAAKQLPYYELIQRAFGRFDVSGVQVHDDARAQEAAHALGAEAYAFGDDVVLGASSDLHTVAHEAAHVVQQRAGIVQLSSGVGHSGDPYERHADAVADAVVAGHSAEPLLAEMLGAAPIAGAAPAGVQRRRDREFALTAAEIEHEAVELHVANDTERDEAPSSAGGYIAGSNVRVTRVAEEVHLIAPLVTWRSHVSLRHPDRLGPDDTVYVGPIQTLTSSNRVGIYKDDNGEVVAEHHSHVRNVRDAMTNRQQRNNPPFYGLPRRLESDRPDTRDNDGVAEELQGPVEFYDSPLARFPVRIGNGTLKEVRGSDNFTLSLGAKHNDTILHISPYDWSVPWNIQLDEIPGASSAGQRGEQVDISEADRGRTPPGGPIAADRAQAAEHVRYPNAEAAAQVDYWTLVGQLEATQRNDPAAARIIIAGMILQNPRVRIKVERASHTSWSDDMVIHVYGHHRAERSAEVGSEHTFDINFRELFHNRDELTTGSHIGVALFEEDSTDQPAGRVQFPFPFEPGDPHDVEASGISYSVCLLAFGSRGGEE